MRSQKTKLTTLGLAICVFLAICAGVADVAAASSVVLAPCSTGSNNLFGSWSPDPAASTQWSLVSRCPSEVTLSTKPGATSSGSWMFPTFPDAHGTFSKVNFDLLGGDGSDVGHLQSVRVCNKNAALCGNAVSPSGPDVAVPAPVELSLANGMIKDGGDRLNIQVQCSGTTAAPCAPGHPMIIQNLRMTIEDNVAPTLQASTVASTTGIPAIKENDWNSGIREIRMRATDVGTGVKYLIYRVVRADKQGGIYWPEDKPACGLAAAPSATIPNLCPQQYESVFTHDFTRAMFQEDLHNGINWVQVTAYDAAGNASAPYEFYVLLDNTVPAIGDLRITPSQPGEWRSTLQPGVAWDYVGDTTPSDTESGIASASYTLTDELTGTTTSKTIDQADISSIDQIDIPNPGRWRFSLRVTDGAGNVSKPVQTTIDVDTTIPEAPALDALPAIGAAQLAAGANVSWAAPSNLPDIVSGICGYTMSVDRNPSADPGASGGIAGDALTARLPSELSSGRHWVHLRAISCAGAAGKIADAPFDVDTAAPAMVASSPGAGGWYSPSNPLSVELAAGPEPGAQIAVSVDGDSSDWRPDSKLNVPLSDGAHSVIATSKDTIGNESSLVLNAKYDGSPPTARFDDFDQAHPTRVQASVGDAFSGVRDAYLQYRAEGSSTWRQFGEITHAIDGGQPSLDVSARLPDTEMPSGRYELRVVATDIAGQTLRGGERPDGSAPMVTLPVRHEPTLTAAFPDGLSVLHCQGSSTSRRCKRVAGRGESTGASDRTTVKFGASETLSGRLIDGDGVPIGDTPVEIFETVFGSAAKRVVVVVTDHNGAYSYRPEPGPSRLITVRFAGSDRAAPAESIARLFTQAEVSLIVSRRHVTGDWRLTFRGKVTAPGAIYPKSGKPMWLQFFTAGHWNNLPNDVAADANGRFTSERDFPATGKRIKYRFRAVVPAADGWAYAEGRSATVTKVLR